LTVENQLVQQEITKELDVPFLSANPPADGSFNSYNSTKFSVMAPLLSLKLPAILALTTVLLLPYALAQTTCATVAPKIAPVVAAGYTARVLMNGLKTPRGMLFDSSGNLLIVEQGGAGVRIVKLTDGDGTNVCVASSKQLIADASVRTFYTFLLCLDRALLVRTEYFIHSRWSKSWSISCFCSKPLPMMKVFGSIAK